MKGESSILKQNNSFDTQTWKSLISNTAQHCVQWESYDFLSKLSVIKSSFCGDIYGSFHLDMSFFSYSFSRMKYSYNEAKPFLKIWAIISWYIVTKILAVI